MSLRTFFQDEAGYKSWTATHPEGWILNVQNPPKPGYLILHRTRCHTINPASHDDRTQWTLQYGKICATSPEDIEKWAQSEFDCEAPLHPCSFCCRER